MALEDKVAVASFLNSALADVESCSQHLPLIAMDDDFFSKLNDGFILCGILNLIEPGTLSERSLSRDVVTAYGESPLTDEQRIENLRIVLDVATEKFSVDVANKERGEINPELILNGVEHEIILGFLWDLISITFLKDITIHKYPELVLLLEDDEEMDSMLYMTAKDILSRWFNYHLIKADDYRARRLEDWSKDLQDSECYALLLKQLVAAASSVSESTSKDMMIKELDFGYTCRLNTTEKAEAIVLTAKHLGVTHSLLTPDNILTGHALLNVIFVGQLFGEVSGLTLNHHVREHVKESIKEFVVMQKEAEEQERLERERIAREEQEKKELEIALEKERQFHLLEEEEKRQEAELELALEKERQHREMEAKAEAEAQRIQKEKEDAAAKEAALLTEKKEEEARMLLMEQKAQEKEESLSTPKDNGTTTTTPEPDDVVIDENINTQQATAVQVIEEVWENQTYLPVRGWGAPRSTVHPFSDKSGVKKITFDKYPSVAGWEWLSTSEEWQVDHSGSFGEVDDEGWCYDSTFDKIIEAIRLGVTSGENKTTNLARRRRLLRTRYCASSQALEDHQNHMAYVSKEILKLDTRLASTQKDYEILKKHENSRRSLQLSLRDESLASISSAQDCFVEFGKELKKLEGFLVAQADAEFRYAEKLEAQYKLYYPDIPSSDATSENDASPTRKRAGTTELLNKTREYLNIKDESVGQTSVDNALTSNVKKASFQFFTGFSDFNSSSANKYRDFGNFILDSVLGDVKGLAEEVNDAIKQSKIELTFVEKNKSLVARLEHAFDVLSNSYVYGVRKCKTKLNVLHSKMRGDVLVPSSSGETARTVSVCDQERNATGGDGCAAQRESVSGPEVDSSFLKATLGHPPQDTHMCLNTYQALVLEYSKNVDALSMASSSLDSSTADFSLKVRQIFVISMQLCCHEKSKICAYNASLMKETSSNFQAWNNAVNVKEFQVQEEKEGETARRKSVSLLSQQVEEVNSEGKHSPKVDASSTFENNMMDPVIPPLPLCDCELVLQQSMKFTTFHDAKKIARDDLDGIEPTVVSDTRNSQVPFKEKGFWMKKNTKVDDSSTMGGGGTSSSSTPPAPPEKFSTKSRFASFFSSKSKDQKTTDSPSTEVVETPTEDELEDGRKRRKSLVESIGDSIGELMDESSHEEVHAESTASLYETQAVVSSDGMLHLYGVTNGMTSSGGYLDSNTEIDSNEKGRGGVTESKFEFANLSPIKSLLLEDCHVIFHDKVSSKHLAFAIEIYPKKHVGGKRVANGLILIPKNRCEALQWLNVLCSPMGGATLLVPLTGIDLEIATYDTNPEGPNSDNIETSFILYEPDAVNPSFEEK